MKPAVKIGLSAVIFWVMSGSLGAAEFFVAPTGNDKDPGTLEKPFATVQRAQAAVVPGDTVYLRGGTYVMKKEQIARRQRARA